MSFTDTLNSKLQDRLSGPSKATLASDLSIATRWPDFLAVLSAVTSMVGRMQPDPVFTALMGADLGVVPHAALSSSDGAYMTVTGHIGRVIIWVKNPILAGAGSDKKIIMSIALDRSISAALGCGEYYADTAEVSGTTADIDSFMAAAEDMIGECLADAAGTSEGEKLLAAARVEIAVPENLTVKSFPPEKSLWHRLVRKARASVGGGKS